MSEQYQISPLLDNLIVGEPFSQRTGVRSCPAMHKDTEDKYIVKIISTPATSSQLDAMLLSGAFHDQEGALQYFKELTVGIEEECNTLEKLSQLEGFLPVTGVQTVEIDEAPGFDTYILSPYRKTLERCLRKDQFTHLAAINLGLDICSALAVCRRSGYLYASLKPENIIVTDEGTYKIGDIGFIALNSLQYASLPDRCRSQYTAPEIADAFASLNKTIDVYALGLILYRIFNGGNLPILDETQPLPSPDYADYEMSEIILKACAANPEDRWQDPVEFGQALVAYMQRNGAHDTPIIPTVADTVVDDVPDEVEEESEDTISTDECTSEEEDATEVVTTGENPCEKVEDDAPSDESPVYTEDSSGNLSFLSDEDELPEEELAQIEYNAVSQEVSDMLTQADDLISHEPPAPVVAPEPIDVQLPEPLPEEVESEPEEIQDTEDPETEEACNKPSSSSDEAEEAPVVDEQEDADDSDTDDIIVPKKRHWLRNTLLVLLALLILAGGYCFYKYYYLQPIEGLRLQGSESTLFVFITSELDESQLDVICTDVYGNQLTKEIANGKAIFEDLAPNSTYTVSVKMRGLHKLIGETEKEYTTPSRTEVVQFSAVTGSEDGSVILGFTIEGQDSDNWKVTYSTASEPTKTVEFTGHIATINGLTVGSEYSFQLEPVTQMYTTGICELKHVASALVRAEDLRITGCVNGTLSVAWSTPENTSVSSWTVHCYNENGYDKTMTTEANTVDFADIDEKSSYTIEVTAAGMSISQRVLMEENSLSVQNFKVDETSGSYLTVQWDSVRSDAQDEFILQYTVDGSALLEVSCRDNSAVITPKIPDSTYQFTLKTADGKIVLGGSEKFTTAPASKFDDYGVIYDNLDFSMCKTPSYSDWNRYSLDDSDYTTTFAVNEKASFLVRIRSEYDTSWDEITTLYLIRDAEGRIVSSDTSVSSWTYMWYRNYGEFDIPVLPSVAGEYNITVYFNGALAGSTNFTIYG